jgi:hypothetical protein
MTLRTFSIVSIAIFMWLVRALNTDSYVLSLVFAELGKLGSKTWEMKAGDFFVQLLR